MFNPNSAVGHYILCVKVRLPLSQRMYMDIQCTDYFFFLEYGPKVPFWEEKQKCKGLSKLSTAAVPLQRAVYRLQAKWLLDSSWAQMWISSIPKARRGGGVSSYLLWSWWHLYSSNMLRNMYVYWPVFLLFCLLLWQKHSPQSWTIQLQSSWKQFVWRSK